MPSSRIRCTVPFTSFLHTLLLRSDNCTHLNSNYISIGHCHQKGKQYIKESVWRHGHSKESREEHDPWSHIIIKNGSHQQFCWLILTFLGYTSNTEGGINRGITKSTVQSGNNQLTWELSTSHSCKNSSLTKRRKTQDKFNFQFELWKWKCELLNGFEFSSIWQHLWAAS